MKRFTRSLLLAAMALVAGSATAAIAADDEPVYVAGGQYTAVLHTQSGRWEVLSLDGQDIDISTSRCAVSTDIPRGVWMLVRDAEGRPELRAPSALALPAGHPETVALRGCGETGGQVPTVHAPQQLIDWIAATSGAVFVDG
jgi:hypothetical protein